MDQRTKLVIGGAVVLTATLVMAGIPEPSPVLYGRVYINGILQTTNLTVLAKADSDGDGDYDDETPVGSYELGSNAAAGHHYVLPIRLESLVDGSTQRTGTAVVDQDVRLFIQRDGTPEQHVGIFTVDTRGQIVYMDLGAHVLGDANGDGLVDLDDHQSFVECMAGPRMAPSPTDASTTTSNCLADFDFDLDHDVDAEDFAAFQASM